MLAIPQHPAASELLGIPAPVLHGLLLVLGLGSFAFILARRLQLLRRAAPDPRLDRIGARLRRLLVVGFGQSRQPRYWVAGPLHILIFAGFLVLSLRSASLMAEGFVAGAAELGAGYAAVKDWTGLLVLAACAVAAFRRLVVRPARYRDRHAPASHTGEALLILGLIALLLIADGVFDAAGLALRNRPAFSWAMPFAGFLSDTIWGFSFHEISADALARIETVRLAAFWLHNVALLFFLCLLPLGKHFHVLTALPNVFLSKLGPSGRIKPPSYCEADLDRLASVGAGTLEELSWKHLLDAYTCTDCGRCSDHCPAYAAGTPLSPRQLSIELRTAAYAAFPLRGAPLPLAQRPALVGEVVTDAALWSCTTCGACEEACPVLIEYVDKIVDMRRWLVDQGRVPSGLQKAMAELEKKGNPYGKMARKRGEWLAEPAAAGAPGARPLAAGEDAELLWFTDSAAAFDPRIQRSARAFANLLQAAGVAAGTLGADEADSGHEARRMGEEGLFQELRDRNLAALGARRCRRVVTTDPHAFNALRHDYALAQPVLHHSQLLAEWLAAGRLRLGPLADARPVVFHDPCYLGRHNGEFDAPRAVLDAIPGLRRREMTRARNRSFCCGGGSLYLFHEGECERRMGELRLEMARAAGAGIVVTACPFCLSNLEDAVKTAGCEGEIEVLDLAELVERALVRGDGGS